MYSISDESKTSANCLTSAVESVSLSFSVCLLDQICHWNQNILFNCHYLKLYQDQRRFFHDLYEEDHISSGFITTSQQAHFNLFIVRNTLSQISSFQIGSTIII